MSIKIEVPVGYAGSVNFRPADGGASDSIGILALAPQMDPGTAIVWYKENGDDKFGVFVSLRERYKPPVEHFVTNGTLRMPALCIHDANKFTDVTIQRLSRSAENWFAIGDSRHDGLLAFAKSYAGKTPPTMNYYRLKLGQKADPPKDGSGNNLSSKHYDLMRGNTVITVGRIWLDGAKVWEHALKPDEYEFLFQGQQGSIVSSTANLAAPTKYWQGTIISELGV